MSCWGQRMVAMGIGYQARGAEAALEVDNVHETELPRRNQEESDHLHICTTLLTGPAARPWGPLAGSDIWDA